MSRFRIPCAIAVYSLISFGSFAAAQSTSGFLVPTLSSIFLLDRYLFHLLNWPAGRSLQREAAWRLLCFLSGATAFYCARFSIVPVCEALFLGLMASLTISCLESIAALLPGICRRIFGSSRFGQNLARLFQGLCLVLFGLTFPYWHTLHPMHTVPKRGPDAMGFAYEDLTVRTQDGVNLSAWVIPAEQAEASVIFCHGHGRNKGHVAGLLATLHEARCNVLAFDFRGHGDSPGHTVNFGGKDIDDLCLMVHYLESRFPGKPILLAGISYGAAVSLEALERLPQVKGLWSEGAFGRLNHAVRRRLDCVPTFVLKPVVRMYYLLGSSTAICGSRA